ncbi:hypothetical protein SSS_10602 [Sarcoptes scabiei]|uniref:Uncharacterized protein n=1 Tax=Sarcoptes scabiei TaxID=52283 RepID=A0A834R287_SARSC|nr:hypothetical protein SSS_10602 [Sarcoptes scabiei]
MSCFSLAMSFMPTIRLERDQLERLQRKSQQNQDEIQRLNNKLIEWTTESTILDSEMKALKERNAILENDSANRNLSQDEIVKRALKMRDETISRKNAVEIELAKVDMEILIEEQLKNKLGLHEKKSVDGNNDNTGNKGNPQTTTKNRFSLTNLSRLLNLSHRSSNSILVPRTINAKTASQLSTSSSPS